MAKLVSLKCPNCGSNVNLEGDYDSKFCFCIHCGAKFAFEAKDIIEQRIVDAARIEEAKANKEVEKAKAIANFLQSEGAKELFICLIMLVAIIGFFLMYWM